MEFRISSTNLVTGFFELDMMSKKEPFIHVKLAAVTANNRGRPTMHVFVGHQDPMHCTLYARWAEGKVLEIFSKVGDVLTKDVLFRMRAFLIDEMRFPAWVVNDKLHPFWARVGREWSGANEGSGGIEATTKQGEDQAVASSLQARSRALLSQPRVLTPRSGPSGHRGPGLAKAAEPNEEVPVPAVRKPAV